MKVKTIIEQMPTFVIITELGQKNRKVKSLTDFSRTLDVPTKKRGYTWCTIVNTVKDLVSEGIIWQEKDGRTKVIGLTDKGKEVYGLICNIRSMVEV